MRGLHNQAGRASAQAQEPKDKKDNHDKADNINDLVHVIPTPCFDR